MHLHLIASNIIWTRQSEGQLYPPPQNDNRAASKFKAQIGGLQLWPWPWVYIEMGSVHHLTKANIWPKFNKYLSKGLGDMEWTWNSRLKLVTFNCDLDPESACVRWVLHIASLRQTFDQNFMKIFQRVQEIWREQERDGWPSIVTLTLILHRWVIDSTHHLTKANIWPKFNKAVWMALEWPENSRLKLVTFNYDLDLESACM